MLFTYRIVVFFVLTRVFFALLRCQTGDFAGESTSGRRRWQQRRGKGKHGGGGRKGSKKTANRFDLPV